MSEIKAKTSSENGTNVEEKEESTGLNKESNKPEFFNAGKQYAASFKIKRRTNKHLRKLHNLKYLETASKSNTRHKMKQSSKSNSFSLPKESIANEKKSTASSYVQNNFFMSSTDVTQLRNSSESSLHITKAVTGIPLHATEVYMNKTTVLKYTQRYLTSDNDSLASTIIDLEKIARLNRLSKYDSSDYSISSCNLIISDSTSGSDTFVRESSNELIRIIKSDNTLKGSCNSNQSSHSDIPNMKTLPKVTIKQSVLNNKNDQANTQNKIEDNIVTNNVDNKTAINSLKTTENYDDAPLYPKIDKIVVDIPTTSRDEMKYHAFLNNQMITTEDPLTLMLRSKDDKLVKNNENAVFVKTDKSITEIPLPNNEKSGKKCIDELRCFSSLTDLWDKLAIYFDVSLKRMEISLTEKILSEIKRSYDKIEKYATEQTQSKLNSIKSKIEIENKPSDVKSNKTKHDYLSEFIQCNIQNQIDKLPFKMNIGDVKINLEDTLEAKQLKKPPFKQYLDTIKPLGVLKKKAEADYEDATRNNENRGNDNNIPGNRRAIVKTIRFVRTNAVVISGVPIFFLALIVIYGIILWVIKIVKIYKTFRH
ncbi:uncharacterized protein LOC121738158 [Aricia agestis]|uniref:uncharacterized protein LOC121738158 n=1 Tax=Aricia agestis TaxID=91739 RepID=UPI001C205EBD|nr:uncharacterized protein LOC121738158 [Aricia agestis]